MSALNLIDFNASRVSEAEKNEVREMLSALDRAEAEIVAAAERERAALLKHYETLYTLKEKEFEARIEQQEQHEARLTSLLPPAAFECTDQANAHRLLRAHGSVLISVAGSFYAWNGRYWQRAEDQAARCAAQLSATVRLEADTFQRQFDEFAVSNPSVAELLKNTKRLDQSNAVAKLQGDAATAAAAKLFTQIAALRKWAVECEMLHRQHAALGMLRSMLTFDAGKLDSDPWLLNCENGTIDLRSGELRPHRPLDYITRCVPVVYDEEAQAPRFEKFVREIVENDETAAFLQRWFGYCATGSIREQALVIHIGAGSNGKSTLLNAVMGVLGEYAGIAAPGLLAALGAHDKHPTELADLQGRRLVTSSEIEDGATLREAFVKQLTGGEPVKARWMREDFYQFSPTHKLQLLTNHRPKILGQDYAIWRRLLLVTYPVKFGSAQDVAEGNAMRLRDGALEEALRTERAGILAWLVRGAVEWYRTGLRSPDSVRLATREYQRDQDRVAQFVEERCVLDREAWSPFDGGMVGLYPAYVQWIRENGYQALGKSRFSHELERVVPGFRRSEQKRGEDGTRKSVYGCYGVRVDNDRWAAGS
jgi:putative DNA primase/helicase